MFDRPRERLLRTGPDALTDAELLTVLIGSGSRTVDAAQVAGALLGRFSDLARLGEAATAELAALPGVGLAKACRLQAALALAGRLGARPFQRGEPVRDGREVWERIGRRLAHLDHEVLLALALDGQNRVITELAIARGGACSVSYRPADVFRVLLRAGATSALLVHNHPSGEPAPSDADVHATERLRLAGELLGVPLVDHLVVARGGYRSCMPAGKAVTSTAE